LAAAITCQRILLELYVSNEKETNSKFEFTRETSSSVGCFHKACVSLSEYVFEATANISKYFSSTQHCFRKDNFASKSGVWEASNFFDNSGLFPELHISFFSILFLF